MTQNQNALQRTIALSALLIALALLASAILPLAAARLGWLGGSDFTAAHAAMMAQMSANQGAMMGGANHAGMMSGSAPYTGMMNGGSGMMSGGMPDAGMMNGGGMWNGFGAWTMGWGGLSMIAWALAFAGLGAAAAAWLLSRGKADPAA